MPSDAQASQARFRIPADDRLGCGAMAMTAVVYTLLAIWTLMGIFISPFFWLTWKVLARWDTGAIIRHLIWFYGRGWLIIVSPFVRLRREGLENLEPGEPSILVVNHLSFFDTYFMALLPIHDITFAVRAWPFTMVWYTLFMRLAGYLNVESSTWEEVFQGARKVLAQGGHLLFFPEGHRSRDGQMQRFYSGAFRLAVETGVPVVPLCLTGTDRLLPPGRLWLHPSRVTLRILAPVDPSDFTGDGAHMALRREVKRRMAQNLAAMQEKDGVA